MNDAHAHAEHEVARTFRPRKKRKQINEYTHGIHPRRHLTHTYTSLSRQRKENPNILKARQGEDHDANISVFRD